MTTLCRLLASRSLLEDSLVLSLVPFSLSLAVVAPSVKLGVIELQPKHLAQVATQADFSLTLGLHQLFITPCRVVYSARWVPTCETPLRTLPPILSQASALFAERAFTRL